jgi:hypothetical protein
MKHRKPALAESRFLEPATPLEEQFQRLEDRVHQRTITGSRHSIAADTL